MDNKEQIDLDRIFSILENVTDTLIEARRKQVLKDFKGTGMKWAFAKTEIDRYVKLGVSKNDIALLVASWGLSTQDLELSCQYLHELNSNNKLKDEPQEGVIL
jgi:hypothetical protein